MSMSTSNIVRVSVNKNSIVNTVRVNNLTVALASGGSRIFLGGALTPRVDVLTY